MRTKGLCSWPTSPKTVARFTKFSRDTTNDDRTRREIVDRIPEVYSDGDQTPR